MFIKRSLSNITVTLSSLFLIVLLVCAIYIPNNSPFNYMQTHLEYTNLPPRLECYFIGKGENLYIHPDLYALHINDQGKIIGRLEEEDNNIFERNKTFILNNQLINVDYSQLREGGDFLVSVNENIIDNKRSLWNNTFKLGTDRLGRDILVRLMQGAQISLSIAFFASIINIAIGVILGTLAGFLGDKVDNLIMRFTDAYSTIPSLLIIMMLMIVLGSGVNTLIFALGISSWVSLARIIRGQVIKIKNEEFIMASRSLGSSNLFIILYHILPSLIPYIISIGSIIIPDMIFTESFLSFIGLGIAPPMASWGSMISDGLDGINLFSYQLIIPVTIVSLTTLSLNFLAKQLGSRGS